MTTIETKDEKTLVKKSVEESLGEKWLAIAGALLLTCGIGFFIKYAIDNGLISYTMRIVIGVLVGGFLASLGLWFREKKVHEVLQKVLISGGLSLVYFVVYLMYYLEDYRNAMNISFSFEMVLLVSIAIVLLGYAVKEKSQLVTFMALLFAFFTSLLGGEFTLFTLIYNLIVALAFGLVAVKMKWASFLIINICFSYIAYIIWMFNNESGFWLSLSFLLVYFFAYATQALSLNWSTQNTKEENSEAEVVSIIAYMLNTAVFVIVSAVLCGQHDNNVLNWLLFGLSVFNFIVAYIMTRIQKIKLAKIVFYAANVLLTYFIFAQFSGAAISLWVLVLALFYFIAWRSAYLKIFAVLSNAALTVALYKVIFIDSYYLPSINLADSFVASRPAMFIYAAVVCSLFYWGAVGVKTKNEFVKNPDMYSWLSFFLLTLLIVMEFGKYQMSIALIALSLILLLIGFAFLVKSYRYQGLALFMLTILKVLFYDLSLSNTLYRTILFLVFGVILLLTSFFYSKFKDKLR